MFELVLQPLADYLDNESLLKLAMVERNTRSQVKQLIKQRRQRQMDSLSAEIHRERVVISCNITFGKNFMLHSTYDYYHRRLCIKKVTVDNRYTQTYVTDHPYMDYSGKDGVEYVRSTLTSIRSTNDTEKAGLKRERFNDFITTLNMYDVEKILIERAGRRWPWLKHLCALKN